MPLQFSRPELLLLLLALLGWGVFVLRRSPSGVMLAEAEHLRRVVGPRRWREVFCRHLAFGLRVSSMICLVVAVAGPQRITLVESLSPRDTGRSIALAIDLSTSMLARDMGDGRTRVAVAREASLRFAEGRLDDELSLVAFGGEAVTRVPPTIDPRVIVAGVASLDVDFVRNGTNISEAILTAIAQLNGSDRETKVVILLTDGAHNQAGVTPYATARAASALGVRVHSISISSPDEGVDPGIGPEAETVLYGISELTGGRYFRATSAADLEAIYLEIDRVESSIEAPTTQEEREPWRGWFLAAALALLAMEILLRGSRWGVIP